MMPSDAFLSFSVLQFADYEMTSGILKRGGHELNPLVRWLIARLGNAGLVLAKLIAVAVGYVLASHGETALLAAGCALSTGIVGWNWRQAQRQRSQA